MVQGDERVDCRISQGESQNPALSCPLTPFPGSPWLLIFVLPMEVAWIRVAWIGNALALPRLRGKVTPCFRASHWLSKTCHIIYFTLKQGTCYPGNCHIKNMDSDISVP